MSRGMPCPDSLRVAVNVARLARPNATDVKPVYMPASERSDYGAEVWFGDRAQVLAIDVVRERVIG